MSKLTADKCREQFEEWVTKGMSEMHKGVMLRRLECSDGYFHTVTRARWEAWQAALEIALPILEQQEQGDDWIKWGGGKRPVISGKQVEVKFRGGEGCIALSGELDWRDTESCGDIIAYRIIPEQPTNQNGEQ